MYHMCFRPGSHAWAGNCFFSQEKMKDTPFFSVIMAAYNAWETMLRAVESLKGQTFADWELIIADDCSTDGTPGVIAGLCGSDSRITSFREKENCGGAYFPRRHAMERARGRYMVQLDADDTIESGYLESLHKRIVETGADAVLCRLAVYTEKGCDVIPDDSFMPMVVPGRELVKHTLGGWRIAFLGAVSGSLYKEVFEEGDEANSIFADEVLSRRLLLKARKVAFSSARYNYLVNEQSVTSRVTERRFCFLSTNGRLMRLAEEHFGRDSEEYSLAASQLFLSLFDALRMVRRLEGGRRSVDRIISEFYRSPLFREARRAQRPGPLKLLSYMPLWLIKPVYLLHDKGKR